ncbi:solute carrier 26 [Cichlidogyrus casuarinus]|uniref:Solute carrier 26 n=1 Tax=Cichlidogyrus casuarinus TaxID=1844966 RepID=A0ABD2PR08_9PLAT
MELLQVASLVNSALMLLVLFALGPLMGPIPEATLSCAILVALKNTLFQLKQVPRLIKTSPIDALIWIFSFVSPICMNIPFGLISSIVFSLLTIVFRSQRTRCEVLGQVPNTNMYLSVTRYRDIVEVSGVKIISTLGPVFFINAQSFVQCFLSKIDFSANKTHHRSRNDAPKTQSKSCSHFCCCDEQQEMAETMLTVVDTESSLCNPNCYIFAVIIDCHDWTIVDSATIYFINEVSSVCEMNGAVALLANLRENHYDYLRTAKVDKFVSNDGSYLDRVFPTIHDAVQFTKNNQHFRFHPENTQTCTPVITV